MYKILIADDEELELKSLRIFLKRNYPELIILPDAKDGTQVVELVLENKPDALILDIEMPGMNGLKALKILRNQGFNGYVIVKTAYGKFVYAQDALHLHVDAYLLKPVKKEELKKHLDMILQQLKEKKQLNEKKRVFNQLDSGFIISLAYCNQENAHIFSEEIISCFQKEISLRLSILCQFTLCPQEGNVLPVLIYSSDYMDEYIYRQLAEDIAEILREISRSVFGMIPKISCGCLISNLGEHLPKIYLSSVLREAEIGRSQLTVSTNLNKALSYLNRHYAEDISLESTANYIGISSNYLSHIFKQETEKNFVEYLTEIRIRKSIELIGQGIDNVQELASLVGYRYSSYFCRQFKKCTGVTVSKYRRAVVKEL